MAESYKSLQPGFSIVELLISLGIIMMILSFVVPGLKKVLGKGNRASTQNILRVVDSAITEYKMDVHVLPEKLEDLDTKPENVQGWAGSYLPEKMQGKPLEDGWGQPLVYKKNERGAKKAYELYSQGDPEKEEEKIEL